MTGVNVNGANATDGVKPPAKKTFLENFDLVFKAVLGVGTLYVGFLAYQLNDKTAENNKKAGENGAAIAVSNLEIAKLKQNLDEQKFGQEQINAAYDRVERYLIDEKRTQPRCSAIIYYVSRLPDADLVKALMEILGQETTSLCIQTAATAVVVKDQAPSVPTGVEAFQEGFVFARNSAENSDVAVYVCDNPDNVTETVKLATAIGTAIGDSKSFGRVTGSYWRQFDGLVPKRGFITFVVDADHPEAKKVEELQQIITAKVAGTQFVIEPNRGKLTRWLISVVACV